MEIFLIGHDYKYAAEQSLLSAQTDLVQTRYDQIYSIISLYSALGGR